jgi:hypothetical protein
MGRVELVEKLFCRSEFSFFRVFKALTDSFLCIGARGNVEQMLINFSVLNHGSGLPIHRKHHGTLTFFQLFHKVTRSATERFESDLQQFGNGCSRKRPPGGKYLVIE